MISTVRLGSRQYEVSLGARLRVEKLPEKKGAIWQGGEVLSFQNDQGKMVFGTPVLEKAGVKARIVRHGKAKKILVLKKKRRKGYRRTQGHRQNFTEIVVTGLSDDQGNWKTFVEKKSTSKKKAQSAKKSEETSSTKKTREPKKTTQPVKDAVKTKVAPTAKAPVKKKATPSAKAAVKTKSSSEKKATTDNKKTAKKKAVDKK